MVKCWKCTTWCIFKDQFSDIRSAKIHEQYPFWIHIAVSKIIANFLLLICILRVFSFLCAFVRFINKYCVTCDCVCLWSVLIYNFLFSHMQRTQKNKKRDRGLDRRRQTVVGNGETATDDVLKPANDECFYMSVCIFFYLSLCLCVVCLNTHHVSKNRGHFYFWNNSVKH